MQRYDIIRMIGKGGMGEVYLAYDSICSRKIALKRIREDLSSHVLLKKRFLREAKIAADLVHPGIVPVFTICSDRDPVYYTMPYIEGYTLKSLLKKAWGDDPLSEELAEQTSVENLLSIFHKICSTVEYVHSRGILHRDLKPDNVLLGLFSEVVILDWGAAVFKEMKEDPCMDIDVPLDHFSFRNMTVPGKVVGTPDYMAPERLSGAPASEKTDIYALGVILYQMLTLSFPFRTKKGKAMRRQGISFPEDVAPHREIPPFLSQVVMKALAADPRERYSSVRELKLAIEQYLRGSPSWFPKVILHIQDTSCWRFHEPILLSKYFPTLKISPALWCSLAISKIESFSEVRLEYTLTRKGLIEGFGMFLPPFEENNYRDFYRGYGFWLHLCDDILFVSLVKDGLEIQKTSHHVPSEKQKFSLAFERQNHRLSLLVDHAVVMLHMDYFPGRGGCIGVIIQDMADLCSGITVLESSSSLQVSCLAVPDAFLNEKLYDHAITFYRRIVESFPGRREGYEAQFRIGIAKLEKASSLSDARGFSEAIEEFSVLHHSPVAPLEYLGKALVYQRLKEYNEEIKSLVLALKRYPQCPEISRVRDHVIYRLREALYRGHRLTLVLMLLVLHVASQSIAPAEEKYFFYGLREKISATLFCSLDVSPVDFRSSKMELLLSFWSGFTAFLPGLFQRSWDLKDYRGLADILYSAMEIGDKEFVVEHSEILRQNLLHIPRSEDIVEIHPEKLLVFLLALQDMIHGELPKKIFSRVEDLDSVLIVYLFDLFAKEALIQGQGEQILNVIPLLVPYLSDQQYREYLLPYEIFAYLWLKEDRKVGDLLSRNYSTDEWLDSRSYAFIFYGCWLALTEDPQLAYIHFSGYSDDSVSPKSLLGWAYSALGLPSQDTNLSYQEQKILLLQKFVFAHCLGNHEERDSYQAAYHLHRQERPL